MAEVLLSLVLGVAMALGYRAIAGQPLPALPGPFGGSRPSRAKGQQLVVPEDLAEAFLYVYALALGFLARDAISAGEVDATTFFGLGIGFLLSLASRLQRNAPQIIQAWTAGPPAQFLCWRARGASNSRRAWDDIVAAIRDGRPPDVDGAERLGYAPRTERARNGDRTAIVTAPDGLEWRVRRCL
jgi:hypothetical protein